MGYLISQSYNSLFKTDNLENALDFLRKLLAQDNQLIKKGTHYEIKVDHSQWDNQENEEA